MPARLNPNPVGTGAGVTKRWFQACSTWRREREREGRERLQGELDRELSRPLIPERERVKGFA